MRTVLPELTCYQERRGRRMGRRAGGGVSFRLTSRLSRRVRAPRVMTMVGSSASGTHRSPDYACDRSVRSIRSVSDPIVESDRRSRLGLEYTLPHGTTTPPPSPPRARAANRNE